MKSIFLIVSFSCILYNVLPLFALPVSCSMNNNMRLYILERIDTKIKPSAESLKEKTDLVIDDSYKPALDVISFNGFPTISSNGNCSDCDQIIECFNDDCVPLEMLMRIMNNYTSSEYRTDIEKITADLNIIREQMGCDVIDITMPEYTCQEKDMNYIIAKDTVKFIGSLTKRYSS